MYGPEYDRQRALAHYRANRDAILERRRLQYQQRTPEQIEADKARSKAWKTANKDRDTAYQQRYREEHREEIREKARERMRKKRAKENTLC